jgi:hypothetical protein
LRSFYQAQYQPYHGRENFVNYLLSFFGVFLKKKAKKETAPRYGVTSRRKARRGGPFHMAAAPLSGRLFQANPNKKKCQALS